LCSPNACAEYAVICSRREGICAWCAGVLDPVGCVGVEVGVGEVDYGFGHFGWVGMSCLLVWLVGKAIRGGLVDVVYLAVRLTSLL
jgi:hypothetical protein